MERMSEYGWFCANCLRMVETLSRHGRCPFCDSNAVDVAYRWSQPKLSEAEGISGNHESPAASYVLSIG